MIYNRFGDTFIRQCAQFFIVFRATAHVGTIRGETVDSVDLVCPSIACLMFGIQAAVADLDLLTVLRLNIVCNG